jgi:hypothetical protein
LCPPIALSLDNAPAVPYFWAGAGGAEGHPATGMVPKGGPMKRILNRLLSFGIVAAFVLQVVSPGPAVAQQAALSDEQVKERLEYIQTALKSGQHRAESWYYGWLGGYSGAALVMGMLGAAHWNDTTPEGAEAVSNRENAQDMVIGSATFALGAISLLYDPFTPALVPDELRAAPETTAEERRLKLERAEKALRDCAEREIRGRGLTNHLLNLGANAAAGIVTSAAFHRPWTDGLTTFAIGEAVSLLNIFSQPTRAASDLKVYEAKYLGKGGAALPVPTERKWTLSVGPGMFTFRYEF